MMFQNGNALGLVAGSARERVLAPVPPGQTIGIRRTDSAHIAFVLGFITVVLIFLLPASLLITLKLYSDAPGDSVLTKFHPATYTAVLGAWFALYGKRRSGGVVGLFRERPGLAWSIALILATTVYSVLNFGLSGIALYVETYLAAALTAVALEMGTPRQLRSLAYTMIVFCLINVVISLMEGATQTHFLPLTPGLLKNGDLGVDEFRGQALYTHPLTGALVTSMALFSVLAMRFRGWIAAAMFGTFMVGLMSFGGRSALFTSLTTLVAAALFQMASGLATRRLNIGFLAAFIAGVFLLPVLFVILTTMTDVGMRIISKMYLNDNSADVRIVQWYVLPLLDFHDMVFGASLARIEQLKVLVGLTGPGADIENGWLLLYLSLGLIGFPIITGALFLFVSHLGKQADMPIAWLVIIVTVLVSATNNSLGRKTPDLIFLTAFTIALSGFGARAKETNEEPAVASEESPWLRRTRLALLPSGPSRILRDQPSMQRLRSGLSPLRTGRQRSG
ncbi:MAG TPA: VpsF family polysaccharide biosynthesis protein [Acetobacteraceae bacterium]|jgi:hypothetical protein|nr:VpsF family polysaccharide biosynthesis protein [Acetobacteraceae bacterium]